MTDIYIQSQCLNSGTDSFTMHYQPLLSMRLNVVPFRDESMPIAKMRPSNYQPSTSSTTAQKPPSQEDNTLASLTPPTSPHEGRPNVKPQRPRVRFGSKLDTAKELLNVSPRQAELLQSLSKSFTANKFRSVVGATLEIKTESPTTAAQLLRALGFNKVPDRWTLTEPRFVKLVELQDGITAEARASIETHHRGATINITIDRGSKLL